MRGIRLEYHDLLSLFEFLDNGDGVITLLGLAILFRDLETSANFCRCFGPQKIFVYLPIILCASFSFFFALCAEAHRIHRRPLLSRTGRQTRGVSQCSHRDCDTLCWFPFFPSICHSYVLKMTVIWSGPCKILHCFITNSLWGCNFKPL